MASTTSTTHRKIHTQIIVFKYLKIFKKNLYIRESTSSQVKFIQNIYSKF